MHPPPLVLLPGLVCDARLWQHQMTLVEPAPWVAELGPGRSIAAFAEHVLAQITQPYFAVAGLSLGGYVALEMLRQAPERIVGLALLDTSAHADTEQARLARQQSINQAKTAFADVIARLLPKLLHPAHLSNPALVMLIESMAAQTGVEVFVRQQRAIAERVDSRELLAKIRCPALVLCGREDLITPLALHKELAQGIAGAKLVVLERCGHLSPLEQPRQVNAALVTWLERL